MVPEHIDWNKIVITYREKAKLAMSLLWSISQWLLLIDDGEELARGIPISSKKWASLVGNDYRHILTALIDANLITRSKEYKQATEGESGECKKHWINTALLQNKSTIIQIDTTLWRKQVEYNEKMFDERYKAIEKECQIPKFVYRKLRDYIHEDLSINITEEQIAYLKTNPVVRNGEEMVLRRADENFIEQIKTSPQHLQVLPADNYRLYSPITQCYHKIRPYLLGHKKSLVEVDVASSQCIYVWKMAVDMFGETPDLLKWKELLENGHFYKHFIALLNDGVEKEEDKIQDKEEFKRVYWFQMLYGPNLRKPGWYKGVKKDDRLFRIIERDFPTMWEFLLKAKSGCSTKKELFSKLAIRCQQTESQIVIGKVVRDFMMRKSRTCIFTIHDSWLLHFEHILFLIELIATNFKEIGIRPSLHIYDYRYSNEDADKRKLIICGLQCEHNIPEWRTI